MTRKFTIYNLQFTIKLAILFFTFYILHSTFYITPVYAQAGSTPAQQSTWEESKPTSQVFQAVPAYVPPTSPLYTDLLVNNLFHSFSCLAIGQSVIGQPCLTYQVTKNAQGMIQSVPMLSSVNLSGGTLGAVTNVIGALYQNPPVRTADYLASVGQGLGLVKTADAQVVGSGQAVLNPILGLWQVSRNISYVLMIIIFLIIGLMVMFRSKINPQTVITAQAAIPGLVIGLILITFSYFLAGLVSDMAFVGTNVVGYYFSIAQHPNDPPQNLVKDVNNRSILNIFTPFTRILSASTVKDALSSIWNDLGDSSIPWYDILALDPQRVIKTLATFMTSQLFLPIGNLAPGVGTAVAAGLSAIAGQGFTLDITAFALAFVGMVALIYAMLRLLLRLINNYLTIIFLTITAPFQFLAAALPGRQGIASDWILNMLANILAFPAVLAVLYFIAFILGPQWQAAFCDHPNQPCPFQIAQSNQREYNTIVPTAQAADPTAHKVINQATFPLFGGLDLNFVELLLAFGALLALPAIPDIVAKSIGKLSQAGQLIGQEIGAGTGAGQKYAGQIQSGTTGAIGQLGRVTDEPGYIYRQVGTGPTGTPIMGWNKVTAKTASGLKLTATEMMQSGYRAGTWTRAKSLFKR